MKILLLLLFLFSFSCIEYAISQEGHHPKIAEYEIDSKVFGGKRLVSVSTPVGYAEKDTNTKYLVAYLFDGQFTPYFNMINSVIQYYSQVGDGVPMVVISIHTENRSLEFTPKANHPETVEGWEGRCGSADKMTAFLREEVIPQVEEKYNVHPYRLGIGHSLGGTYVMTEILKNKSLFNAAIAISPNMLYDTEQVVEQGKRYFRAEPNARAFIYCSAGDQGKMENSFRVSLEKLHADAQENLPKKMTWTYEMLKGDSHMSTFLPTFDNGYLAFSEKWILTETKMNALTESNQPLLDFENFFAQISDFAGFDYRPNSNDYNDFAYTLDYFDKQNLAIEVLNKAISLFPTDANLYDSRGEMFEKLGQDKEAHASFALALKTLEQNKSIYDEESYQYYLNTFTGNMERTAGE